MIGLPDINEFLADLNGRLFPIGWLMLLWRLRFRQTESARVPILGLQKRYGGSPTGAALLASMMKRYITAAQAANVRTLEYSWILEDNAASLGVARAVGGHLAKTYRIFAKQLE